MRGLSGAAKRIVLETLGWILVVGGIAALVLPGPGLLGIFAGLALLSQQYEWAERRVDPIKEKALKAAAEGVETPTRITLSVTAALILMACGVLWIWSPPAPGWWPVDDGGGCSAASAPASPRSLSGLIAIGMIVYSYRRFRSGPA